ncbi:MAG: helix-turn-helix domain-containing protein [Ruminococcus sp.]|nr:helix-turn-helix domain-containing protein [Ruminococcus sp.]
MNYSLFEELCKNNNTNPTALSKKIGLSKGNTSNWKNGGNPSVDVLCRIADELNCTTDALLGREENQTITLTVDEQELLENYSKLTDEDKVEISKRAEGLANGIALETNEDRKDIFKPVYYSDLREKEMLMLFRNLSEHEQERLIGRAELLVEQAKLEESAG